MPDENKQINDSSAKEIACENRFAESARMAGSDTASNISKDSQKEIRTEKSSASAELKSENESADAARTEGSNTATEIRKSANSELSQERMDSDAARTEGSNTGAKINRDAQAEISSERRDAGLAASTSHPATIVNINPNSGRNRSNSPGSPDVGGIDASPAAGQCLPFFDPLKGRPSPLSASDMNRIVNAVNAFIRLQILAPDGSVGGELKLSQNDAIIALFGSSGSGGSGSATTPMTIVSEQADYLTCTNSAGATVYVAKPWLLQASIYEEGTWTYVDGTHTYTEVSASSRSDAVTGGGTYSQTIWFPYSVGDVIYCDQSATALKDANGNPIVWQDLNFDRRSWATQATACISINGTSYPGFQLIKGSGYYATSIG